MTENTFSIIFASNTLVASILSSTNKYYFKNNEEISSIISEIDHHFPRLTKKIMVKDNRSQ